MTLSNAATPWVYLRELLMLGYIMSFAFTVFEGIGILLILK